MRISTETQTATDEFVAGLNPAHIALLKGVTVKLCGTIKGDYFAGTGVITRINFNEHKAYVLTATHNLQKAAKTMDPEEMQHAFLEKIRAQLWYENTESKITAVTASYGPLNRKSYDVCCLEITCRDFVRATRTFLTQQASAFLSKYFRTKHGEDSSALWWDIFNLYDAQLVLGNEGGYGTPRDDYVLIQLGYGRSRGDTSGDFEFRWRILKMADLVKPYGAPVHLLSSTFEGHEEVFTFPTTEQDTTLPGDSGGPIFALNPALDRTNSRQQHTWLLGLTLGANYHEKREDNLPGIRNNAITVLTSERLGVSTGYVENFY